ncbi:MAG: type II secretion system protein [Planctomycetota bacterium]
MMQKRTLTSRTVKLARAGFTLLELLIVLAIILVIAGMVVPNLIGSQQTANEQSTLVRIKNAQSAVENYASQHDGVFPAGSGAEIWDLLINPQPYKGRKLKPFIEEPPTDAWGNVLYYEWNKDGGHSKKQNALKPAIWSAGPNNDGDGSNPNGLPLNNWTSSANTAK